MIAVCMAGAQAQGQGTAGALEEVIVTGTQIRGIAAPVGSVSQTLSREDVELSPAMTVTDMLQTIPEVSALGGVMFEGGVNQQNANRNAAAKRTTNLRGLGPGATLVLVEGQRPAVNGAGYAFFDLDTIPAIALSSVAVVADGASAIYGADAVAGVVDLRLRRNFEGQETGLRYDTVDGTNARMLTHILGSSWDEGNLVLAYELNDREALSAADRSDIVTDDWSAYGGNVSGVFANPGNIAVGTGMGMGMGASTYYPIPAGQDGQNLLLSDLAAGAPRRQDSWLADQVMPAIERHSVLGSLRHRLNDNIELDLLGWFSQKQVEDLGGGLEESVLVPSTNPFSPCNPAKDPSGNPGINCAAPISVIYSMINDLSEDERLTQTNAFVAAGLNFNLTEQWSGEFKLSYGLNAENSIEATYNRNHILRAAGNTIDGTTKPATLPFFNPFCDGDAYACNDQAIFDYIAAEDRIDLEARQSRLSVRADGPLGNTNVRMAVGGEYRTEELDDVQLNASTTSSPSVYSENPNFTERSVSAVFAEMYVPLLEDKLELSLAARHEDYDDFGTSTNPKLGLNWSPIDNVRIRASYGESFRAPQLWEKQRKLSFIRPFSRFPAAFYGFPGQDPLQMIFTSGGGGPDLGPEEAVTYSFGVDFTMESGFDATLNFYQIEIVNVIEQSLSQIGVPQTIAASPTFDQFYDYNPLWYPDRADMSQAEYDALVTALLNNPIAAGDPAMPLDRIVIVGSGAPDNIATLQTPGVDLRLSQRWDTERGQYWASFWASYIDKFEKSAAPGFPAVDRVNQMGQPMQFTARTQVGWNRGPFTAAAFVNYTNGYFLTDENTFARTLPGVDPSFREIDALTTLDFTFHYSTQNRPSGDLLDGVSLNVSVQNVTDEPPPLALNVQLRPVLYDPINAGAALYGRRLSINLTKLW